MRRKRFQHAADVLCQMFCGWRLIGSKPRLVQLGSGTIEINALTGKCLFDGKPVDELPIAKELQLWLHKDLATHRIPVEALTRARLAASLSFSQISRGERTKRGEMFYIEGKAVRSGKMHRCIIECQSEIATDDAVYRSNRRDLEEWPLGWPAAKEN